MNDDILNQLNKYTLLFIENEKGIRDNLSEYFKLLFKKVYIAVDGVEGFELYKQNQPDLIITDIKMANMDGIELVTRIRKEDKDTIIVIISAHTDVEYLLSSIELNLLKYSVKPLNDIKLEEIFQKFLYLKHKSNEVNFSFENSKISFNNKTYCLSLKESLFLNKIINDKRIISYEEIEIDIWDNKSMSQNALRLFIKNLRKKLPDNFIKNVPNYGYTKEDKN